MRTVVVVAMIFGACGIEANGQSGPLPNATETLRLVESGKSHEVDIRLAVDDLPYDQYWIKAIDAVFAFADGNSDGVLSEDEIGLVPSARAVRLSLGTGFTPPVAPIQSLIEIADSGSANCSKAELQAYYRRHGVGRPTIGHGKLPYTAALTKALVQSLDEDRNGKMSEAELAKGETVLRRLDANDDDLIGVGELVPNGTYPGNWASNTLSATGSIDLSVAGDKSFVLSRSPTDSKASGSADSRQNWQITIADQVRELPLKLTTKARCESWAVRVPLSDLTGQLSEELAIAEVESTAGAAEGTRNRDRRPTHAWLIPVVDRDHDGKASPQEIDQWLALQRQLVHGQLLISLYHGGGLFELLDANHDAGLSVRELRSAWQVLESASCTADGQLDVHRVPNVVMCIVSQGYPSSLAKSNVTDVEWFRRMDRNSDGDVSRREFTGTPEAFARLDKDRDGLISTQEAVAGN